MLQAWMFNCRQFHRHPPQEQLPFVNPFEHGDEAGSSRSRPDLATLNREARPLPHFSLQSGTPRSSKRGQRSVSPVKKSDIPSTPSSPSKSSSSVDTSLSGLILEDEYFVIRYKGGSDLLSNL
jgi:hypothetical protein